MGSGCAKQSSVNDGRGHHHNDNNNNNTAINVDDELQHPDHAYEFFTSVLNDDTAVPYELIETAEHYFVVLELPGVPSIKHVQVVCLVTDTGYEVSVTGSKPSAVDFSTQPKEMIVEGGGGATCTRRLGDVSWHGIVYGVYEGQPECNYREGIFKMRLKKRVERAEEITFSEF
eukprot:PhM_4_TR9236/c1_g1_i1/m.72572